MPAQALYKSRRERRSRSFPFEANFPSSSIYWVRAAPQENNTGFLSLNRIEDPDGSSDVITVSAFPLPMLGPPEPFRVIRAEDFFDRIVDSLLVPPTEILVISPECRSVRGRPRQRFSVRL